jgi:maltose O-acetyltransferase
MLTEIPFRMRLSSRRAAAMARSVRENVVAYARARLVLRASDSVGSRARCFGPALLENAGGMRIGHDFSFGGRLGAVQMATAVGGLIGIGDEVTIGSGTSITARMLVSIGHRVRVGPHCIVSDTELPFPLDTPADAAPRGIMIGDDVWIGPRVTVMPGVRIGARAVVAAGSVVMDDIENDALAAGNPATMVRVSPRDLEVVRRPRRWAR